MSNPIPPVPGPGLDPFAVLATGVHACPGVYALLLGSGISTSAGVPTGWQVVSDLVKRVAVAAHPNNPNAASEAAADPEEWWRCNGDGNDLGYSNLLEAMGTTPAARQALLSRYFDPPAEEGAEKAPGPGGAHKAIARLVARGSIRVILTTNFDRLLERALDEEGVQPQVIHRPDQVNAMTPVQHARVTVVKLHGDYADLEQRNTVDELSTYPTEYADLLDTILSEYGLIVSGWSADWDHALVSAIERRATRRYPIFWGAFGALSNSATRLVAQQQATVLTGIGADELFSGLFARLDALDSLATPPLTRDMAVARLKRALPDPGRRIELFDLVDREANRVVSEVMDTAQFPVHLPAGAGYSEFEGWLGGMRGQVDTLLHLLATGVFHDDGVHTELWTRSVATLMRARGRVTGAHHTQLDTYRHYPALLALWVSGISAIHARREATLAKLLLTPQWRPWVGGGALTPAVHAIHPWSVLDHDWLNGMPRWGGTKWKYPRSELLRIEGREPLRPLIADDATYEDACDRFECIAAMIAMDIPVTPGSPRPWLGKFILDSRTDNDGLTLPQRLASEVSDDWALLQGGAFGGDPERARAAAEAIPTFIRERNISTW